MKNQTFGIEIETTGLGRERTAHAIAAFFGTTATHRGRHLDDWVIPTQDGRKWVVERDGSVTDPSAEVVSPVCRWQDIETVQALVRHLRRAGAKVDGSCGIHVHIGLGEYTPESLRRLVNIESIRIYSDHRLVFHFYDGRVEERIWQNPSRRESWTPEMKQQAAMHAGKRYSHE